MTGESTIVVIGAGVKIAQGATILGHISGKMRQNKIQILAGDKVQVEMSPYDLSKCRITYRAR